MTKLLAALNANPADAKAKAKLEAYLAKHPMAICLMLPCDIALLRALEVKGV